MLISDNWIYDLFGIFVALVAILIVYSRWVLGYWERKGVKGPDAGVPANITKDLLLQRKTLGELYRDIYFNLKSQGLRHGGAYFFLRPQYVAVDLEIVKNILQTDFQYFWGHGSYVNDKTDPLSSNVFNLEGQRWKDIRTKLTPTFTSGKMKMMFQILADYSEDLKTLLEVSSQKNPVNLHDIIGRYTTDNIVSCGFGLDSNCMKDENSEFRKYGLKVFELNFFQSIKQLIPIFIPHRLLDLINFCRTEKTVSQYFQNIVRETIHYREKNNVIRPDFMHMLIQLKNRGHISDDGIISNNNKDSKGIMTFNEIAAQCFIFFLAGFETSSTTVHFASYELAINPDIQEKARKEIFRVLKKYENKMTYEAVNEMVYLENVICETLRKFPPLQFIFRQCNKQYKVPGSDVVIEEGTSVILPILGIQYDPEYYPDPQKFEPDRFTEENKQTRPNFTWMPFGEGPRICIGMRFGILQSKVALITLLTNYKLVLNPKTKTPVEFNKKGLVTSIKGGVWIDLHKL